MEAKHLMQLAIVLDCGSISRAAGKLHISQPTLTKNMQTLEMQAGEPLFTRSRHGVRHTTLGGMLAREGRAIAKSVWAAEQSATCFGLGMQTELRIGVGPLVASLLMHTVTESLLHHHPNLSLLIRVDTPYRLFEQINDDELDIAVAPTMVSASQELDRITLFEDRLAIFASRHHPLAQQERVEIDDLSGYPWINIATYAKFEESPVERLQKAGLKQVNTHITLAGDAMICLNILPTGDYLSIMPKRVTDIAAPRFGLQSLPVEADFGERNMHLWHPPALAGDAMLDAVARAFMATLEAATATQPTEKGSAGAMPAEPR
ncbi:LysR family transcriptional regulator [Halomonas sp. HK25]|uniref:LysR family transcriptional regulator n=1 Tax=Halomonas sp. HK25 TaxID=3394321 RepID=UPI0039FC4423